MGALEVAGVREIHHYTPLHYLPFIIARAGALLSKPTMRSRGFQDSHFRSMSSRHDVAREFGEYAFLTLHPASPILRAKLAAGFPHVRITVDATSVDAVAYDPSRFPTRVAPNLGTGP
jgi:hypothetical protein